MTGNPNASTRATGSRTARSIALCLVAFAALTVVDLWTKQWARDELSAPKAASVAPPVCTPDSSGHLGLRRQPIRPKVLIEGHLQLRYTENCGGAFGLMRTSPSWVRGTIFAVAAVGFIGWLMWVYVQGGGGRTFAVAVPVVMSGALGNLIDRINYGYVVDFIRYHGLFEYPTFNIADIFITMGGVLLMLDGFAKKVPADTVEPNAETAAT